MGLRPAVVVHHGTAASTCFAISRVARCLLRWRGFPAGRRVCMRSSLSGLLALHLKVSRIPESAEGTPWPVKAPGGTSGVHIVASSTLRLTAGDDLHHVQGLIPADAGFLSLRRRCTIRPPGCRGRPHLASIYGDSRPSIRAAWCKGTRVDSNHHLRQWGVLPLDDKAGFEPASPSPGVLPLYDAFRPAVALETAGVPCGFA